MSEFMVEVGIIGVHAGETGDVQSGIGIAGSSISVAPSTTRGEML